MENLAQLENFYDTKYSKGDLCAAVNKINSTRVDLELMLKEQLTIKDFVFLYLSYKTSWHDFMYIWKSFSQKPEPKYLARTSLDVIRDRYENKTKLCMEIRNYLAAKIKN